MKGHRVYGENRLSPSHQCDEWYDSNANIPMCFDNLKRANHSKYIVSHYNAAPSNRLIDFKSVNAGIAALIDCLLQIWLTATFSPSTFHSIRLFMKRVQTKWRLLYRVLILFGCVAIIKSLLHVQIKFSIHFRNSATKLCFFAMSLVY